MSVNADESGDSPKEVSSPIPRNTPSSTRQGPGYLVAFFAVGLIATFFLPWINLLLVKASGYAIAMEGGKYSLVWLVPAAGFAAILASQSQQSLVSVALTAGLIPPALLALGVMREGRALLDLLEVGAYGSLACGFGLIFVAVTTMKERQGCEN